MAKAYVEMVSKFVNDVTIEDYKSFTGYLERADKDIVLSPPNFIAYLTGFNQKVCTDCFLRFTKLDKKMDKRPSLVR